LKTPDLLSPLLQTKAYWPPFDILFSVPIFSFGDFCLFFPSFAQLLLFCRLLYLPTTPSSFPLATCRGIVHVPLANFLTPHPPLNRTTDFFLRFFCISIAARLALSPFARKLEVRLFCAWQLPGCFGWTFPRSVGCAVSSFCCFPFLRSLRVMLSLPPSPFLGRPRLTSSFSFHRAGPSFVSPLVDVWSSLLKLPLWDWSVPSVFLLVFRLVD